MKKPLVIALAVVGVVILAVGGAVAFWALNDSADDEFQLSETSGDNAVTTTAPSESGAGASGSTNWVIAEGSEAGYRIDEVLQGLNKTATGRTEDIEGSLVLDGSGVSEMTVTVQTGTLTSDESLRDTKVRETYLQSDTFPTATFTLTDPIPLDADPAVGEPVSVEVDGRLELHGVTKDVTVEIDAQLTADDALEVIGSIPITLADYDIEVPDVAGIVKAAPQGLLEFKLALTPA